MLDFPEEYDACHDRDNEAIIKRAAADADFRSRLIADPAATLRDAGLEVPDGVAVKVLEDSPILAHLVLPAADTAGDLSDADLDLVAGGKAKEPNTYCPSATTAGCW